MFLKRSESRIEDPNRSTPPLPSLTYPRSVPAFFRFVRPASGFGAHDTAYEEFKGRWKKFNDADVFGSTNGQASKMRRL